MPTLWLSCGLQVGCSLAMEPRSRIMRFNHWRRREFMTLFGCGAVAWPLVARAQQTGKIYRIGFLANDPTIPLQVAGRAFLDALSESGFIEGKNIIIERRYA